MRQRCAAALLVVHVDRLVLRRAGIARAERPPAVALVEVHKDVLAVACAGDTHRHLDVCAADLVGDGEHLLREVIARTQPGDLCTREVDGRRRGSEHVLQALVGGGARLGAQVTYQFVLQLRRQAAEQLRVGVEIVGGELVHQSAQLALGREAQILLARRVALERLFERRELVGVLVVVLALGLLGRAGRLVHPAGHLRTVGAPDRVVVHRVL